MFNWVGDRIVNGKLYPNIAQHSAEPYTQAWRLFGNYAPGSVPFDIIEHNDCHDFPQQISTLDNFTPINAYYPVQLAYHDWAINYYELLSDQLCELMRAGQIKMLLFYDEADSPKRLENRGSHERQLLNLPDDSCRLVTANTAVSTVPNGVYFCHDELLYWHRNRRSAACEAHSRRRPYKMTALCRTPKYWRAVALADLSRRGLLKDCIYSYNSDLSINDDIIDCPIEIDRLGIRDYLHTWLSSAPYRADQLSAAAHNDHHLTVREHHELSYLNLVLETHMDCDQSSGVFLTEKTFKPIKHGQPFVIAGAAGSLQLLRDMGYRTFDTVIDPTYDLIANTTDRWIAIQQLLTSVLNSDLQAVYEACWPDICHNQQLFLASKRDRLNTLYDKLLY